MKHEFKTIKTENETRYILETTSGGVTGTSSVASFPVALRKIRKRIQELQHQVAKQQVMELEKPTGSMFLKFITKQLPEDEKQVYGYAGFATDPRELRAATAKIKPFTIDSFDDVENNIEKILSDRDFIGVEKIIVVTKNLPDQYLDDLTALTDITDRVEIYQGDDDEPEKAPSGTMMRKNPETGSWEKVQKGAPKAQVAGSSHRIEPQTKTFKYTLKNKDLMPKLRSMGFKFDGDQITLNKQQRDMLLSKLGDKFNTVFGAGEKFVEDHEISMASSELMSIIEDATRLLKLVRQYSEMEGLEAWQQSKLTKAADYLNSVLNSLQGEQAFNTEDHNDFGNGWGQGSYETYAGTRHGRGVAEGPKIPMVKDPETGRKHPDYGNTGIMGDLAAAAQKRKSQTPLEPTKSNPNDLSKYNDFPDTNKHSWMPVMIGEPSWANIPKSLEVWARRKGIHRDIDISHDPEGKIWTIKGKSGYPHDTEYTYRWEYNYDDNQFEPVEKK